MGVCGQVLHLMHPWFVLASCGAAAVAGVDAAADILLLVPAGLLQDMTHAGKQPACFALCARQACDL